MTDSGATVWCYCLRLYCFHFYLRISYLRLLASFSIHIIGNIMQQWFFVLTVAQQNTVALARWPFLCCIFKMPGSNFCSNGKFTCHFMMLLLKTWLLLLQQMHVSVLIAAFVKLLVRIFTYLVMTNSRSSVILWHY